MNKRQSNHYGRIVKLKEGQIPWFRACPSSCGLFSDTLGAGTGVLAGAIVRGTQQLSRDSNAAGGTDCCSLLTASTIVCTSDFRSWANRLNQGRLWVLSSLFFFFFVKAGFFQKVSRLGFIAALLKRYSKIKKGIYADFWGSKPAVSALFGKTHSLPLHCKQLYMLCSQNTDARSRSFVSQINLNKM